MVVWVVDGNYVRTRYGTQGEEFTNFGQGLEFTFIPTDEIWLDDEADPNEAEYFMANALAQFRAMQAGKSYDEALSIGDRRERNMRAKSNHTPMQIKQGKPEDAKIVLLGTIETVYEEESLHTCGDCGAELDEIRPGKYQCPNCE